MTEPIYFQCEHCGEGFEMSREGNKVTVDLSEHIPPEGEIVFVARECLTCLQERIKRDGEGLSNPVGFFRDKQ